MWSLSHSMFDWRISQMVPREYRSIKSTITIKWQWQQQQQQQPNSDKQTNRMNRNETDEEKWRTTRLFHAYFSILLRERDDRCRLTAVYVWRDSSETIFPKKVMTMTNRNTNRSKATLIYILTHSWFSDIQQSTHMPCEHWNSYGSTYTFVPLILFICKLVGFCFLIFFSSLAWCITLNQMHEKFECSFFCGGCVFYGAHTYIHQGMKCNCFYFD